MPIFNVPGRGPVQLPDGYTKEEYQRVLQSMQAEKEYKPEYSGVAAVMSPLVRGAQNLAAGYRYDLPALGLAALARTGIPALEQLEYPARELLQQGTEEYARIAKERPRSYETFEDVKGPIDAVGYGLERFGEFIPQLGTYLTGAGIGGAGARMLARKASKDFSEELLSKGVAPGLLSKETADAAIAGRLANIAAAGQAGSKAATSGLAFTQLAPETFRNVYEETGKLEPGISSLYGGIGMLIERIVPDRIKDTLGNFGKIKIAENAAKLSGRMEAAKILAKEAAIVSQMEGLTEVAQGIISNAAAKYVDDNIQLFSDKRIKDYLEQYFSGAASGGGAGVISKVPEAISAKRQIEEAQKPLAPAPQAETQPPQLPPPSGGPQLSPGAPQLTAPSALPQLPAPPVAQPSELIPPRGGIIEQGPTNQVVTPETSSTIDIPPAEEPGQTVESFANELVAGTLKPTPETQRFYVNNAPAIEARLKELQAAPKDLSVTVPPSETVQLATEPTEIAAPTVEPVAEQGPPEFVEPPPEQGPPPLPEDVKAYEEDIIRLEKRAAAIEARDRKLKAKGQTLLSTIKKYGGLTDKDIFNIREKDLDTRLDELVRSSRLDPWLPEHLTSYSFPEDKPDTKFLQSQAIEYIKDRLRARDYVSEDTKRELERIGLELDRAMEYVRNYYDELAANLKAAEAADEQRAVYEQVEPVITEGEERTPEPSEAARPAEVQITPRSYAEQMMSGTLPDTDENNAYFEANRDEIEKALMDLEERRAESMMRGTAAQKKTAESHASDLGGLVAYLDGDLALIRGHSKLTGQPVYIPAKGDYRVEKDIEAYTGNLVNAKEKAKLVAAKNAIEAKEADKHAKSPFITFDSQGVAVSQSVSPQLKGVLAGWKKLLKITPNIYVTTISDIEANLDKFTGPHRAVGSAALGNEYGSVRKMADGEYYIAFTDGMSMSRMLETLAHELGHMHMRETFENADVATQKAIRDEYDKWLKSIKGKSAREHIQSMRARGLGKLEKIGEKRKSEDLDPYWTFFKEWYADQVSRWATTSEKPLNVVERFFKRLADAMRSFYAKLRNQKYLPNETFKQYMDKVTANIDYVGPIRVPAKPLGKLDQMALFMNRLDPSDTEVLYMRRAADDFIDAGKDMSPEDREKLLQDVDQIDTTPQKGMNAMDSMIKETPSFQQVKEKFGTYVNNATTDNADTLLAFLNMRQISEISKKDLPQFAQYYRLINTMIDERGANQTKAAKILQEWNDWATKNPELSEALDKVMMDARMSGIDPTDPKKEAKIKKESFRTNWNKIKGNEGEQIFIRVRDFWKGQLNEKLKILEKKIEAMQTDQTERQKTIAEIRAEFDKFLTDGPYFPLNRFGDYFVAYDVKQSDGTTKPYHEMFESQVDQRRHLDAIEKDIKSGKVTNLKTGVDTKEMMSKGVIQSQFLNKAFAAVDKLDQGDLYKDTKQRMKDDIYQAYLSMMPDLSAHKHFIHAKKVAGASYDFRRGFADTAFHNINHLSRLKYGYTLDQIVADASRFAKASNKNASGRYLRELDKMHSDFSNPQKQNPIWSKISNFSFLFYLTAPVSAIANMTQTPIIGIPTMAGEFNVSYAKVGSMVGTASKEFFSSRKGIEFDMIGQLKKQAEALRKAGRNEAADKIDFEAKILTELESTLNQTQTLSLAGVAERPSFLYAKGIRNVLRAKGMSILEKVNYLLGYAFNQAEIYNRYVTALVAIRLANEANAKSKAAGGFSKYDPADIARDMVRQIHFEYSAETKPRFMRGPFGQVALQFKNYSQQITYLLATSFKRALFSNAEIKALRLKSLDQGLSESDRLDAKREYEEAVELRRAARKRLTGIMGMTALFSGYEGLPMYWVVEGTMNMIFGDEDEPYDFSLERKVDLAEMFGDNVARIFSRGAISELLQVDLASRTSLNGIWFRDDASAKDEEEWTKNMLIDLMGPAAGIVVNTGDAIKKINEGHYWRGTEAMMPPVIKDFFKAARFATEGATTLRGDPIDPDISAYNVFMQALGFTPTDVARGYEAMGEIKGLEKKIEQRRSRLLGKLWLAHQNGDYESYAEIGEEIVKFNAANPNEPIEEKTIRNSFAQRQRTAERAERGIIVSPKREYLLEKMSYLDEE